MLKLAKSSATFAYKKLKTERYYWRTNENEVPMTHQEKDFLDERTSLLTAANSEDSSIYFNCSSNKYAT
jgi:hypothetical protein